MKIMLNEKEYAKHVYENNLLVENKPVPTIMLLAKYFIQELNMSEIEAVKQIDEFMYKNFPGYYDSDWYKTVLNCIKTAKKYPLGVVDKIKVYASELEVIASIDDLNLQKLAFTILVCAKYRNNKFNVNSSWCNIEFREIFKLANVTYRKDEYLHQLRQLVVANIIEVSLSEKNYLRPTFLTNTGDAVLSIESIEDLGKQYHVYIGTHFFCGRCGKYEKQNKNKTKKYCAKCRPDVKREIDRTYRRKTRENIEK